MSVKLVFPTYIYTGSLGAAGRKLNKQLNKEIQVLAQIDKAGQTWSKRNYIGGYSSYGSMTKLNQTSPYFGELEQRLRSHVKKFVRKLNWDLLGRKLEMTTCWANSMGHATYHTLHSHPLSVLSGVYYVDVPAHSSPFKVEDPRLSFLMNSPPRKPTAPANEQNYLLIQPKAAEFVLFESWVRHEVPPHRGQKNRLSVSFNYEF